MKLGKSIVFVFMVLFALNIFARDGYNAKDEKKAERHQQYADEYTKKAVFYEQKVKTVTGELAGVYKSLAENYYNCAQQNVRLSEAFLTGDSVLSKDAQGKYNLLTREGKELIDKKDKMESYNSKY